MMWYMTCNICLRLRWWYDAKNLKLSNIITCPNILYYTIDRIIDWDAGLPFIFIHAEHLNNPNSFILFWMCRYEIWGFFFFYTVTKVFTIWREMWLCACSFCYLSHYTSTCLVSGRTCSRVTVSKPTEWWIAHTAVAGSFLEASLDWWMEFIYTQWCDML